MFFQKIEKDLDDLSFKKIFGALTLEVCDAGQKLFNYGDVGKKFYIIIEGSVYILPPTEETRLAEQESKLDPKKKPIIKMATKLDLERKRAELSNFLTDSIKEEIKVAKLQEAYPGLFVLKSIGQGEGFGELAFQGNGERKRAATIVCRQKTLLGCLSYEDFQSILSNTRFMNSISNSCFSFTLSEKIS